MKINAEQERKKHEGFSIVENSDSKPFIKCLCAEVLKSVLSTVNYIKSYVLNHRQCRELIEEIRENDFP